MEQITVQTPINESIEKVWQYYTEPAHITKWAFADDSWIAPHAENDLRVGGKFNTRMERKMVSREVESGARPEPDGARRGRATFQEESMRDVQGFDFSGTYTDVVPMKKIAYTMDGDDRRNVVVTFEEVGNSTHVAVTFDPENENPIEMQKAGWQGILENFKKHTEAH